MTVAVAIVDGDSTVFGCDSEISLGRKRFPVSMAERPSKWSVHGSWGICVSGDSAMGTLIDRHAERWMMKETQFPPRLGRNPHKRDRLMLKE